MTAGRREDKISGRHVNVQTLERNIYNEADKEEERDKVEKGVRDSISG